MSSNNNFKETFLTKKGDDVTIGEDSTDTMVINSNAEFNSQTTFNSQINMGGPIIPTINDQFDIGSAEYKVRDLYLSSNSLHIGDITLSEDIDEVNNERNIKIKTGDGTENEFKLAKLDTQGRLPEDKMPNGLLNSDGKIDKSSIDPTLSLNDLSNVDTTTGVEDGKALVYSSGTWKPGTVATSGGASALNDLTDVSVSGASNGQSLVYNSTSGDWEPGTVSGFTQEQALAGAGGTAAFTPYGIYLTTYITTEANNTLGYFHTDHGISKLFDNNLNEQGCFLKNDNNFPVSFAIDFNTPQIITKYRIWPRATSAERDDEAPSSWEIRASDTKALYDGGSYTILDSQSGLVETDWDQTIVYTSGGTETASNNLSKSNEYHLSSIGAYRYYVLYITNNCGNSNSVGLGEWGLYGGGFTLPSQVGNAGKYLKTDGTALEWAEVSGGGGGTSVTAHTDTQTGDEDYLSALTVGNTKYKIGTSVQNISYTSYSDSSKLHLSFPFQKASSSADALVNQVDGVDATTYNTTFTEGTGFVYDTSVDYDDYSEIDVTGSISGNFSIYMRYYVTSSSPNYQMLLEAYDGDSNTTSLYTNIYWISTNNLMKFAYNNTSNVRNELETNAFVPGRWYNVCVVYNDNITTVYTDEDSYGVMKNMNTATNSNTQNITKIRLGGVTGLNTGGKTLRGKISDFYVFKTALSAFDVQGWANYINNNYITPGFPAPLKFLADVSDTTPQTGDSLVYSGISNKWQPQRAASQFGLPAGDNAKLWVVAGESISRVGNYPIEHVGTGRTFNYDGDGHLYLSNPTGVSPVYLQVDSSNATVPPNGAFTVAVVIDFDSSTSNHRSYLWAQAKHNDSELFYSSPHLIYYHDTDTLVFDYYRDNSSNTYFPFSGNGNLHGKMILVLTRQPSNGTTNWNATVSVYKNGTQFGSSITATDELRLVTHNLDVDRVILTGEPSQDGFHGNHKFYATAVWDRVLTTDEINQLTIDKLVSKRQTLPFYQISDNTPIDGQNLVYSSSTGQYEPKHASPTEIESQLCGGSLGTNDITTGWPRASTVYGNANGTTYPDRLFDNIVTHQYTEQAGWTSLFDYSSVNNYSKVWNDSTEQYDSANSTHANGEDQLQMRFNQPRTITKIMMLWRQGVPFQFPKALRIFGSNTQPSAVSSYAGMNLLFQTDGTGYSQPQITTYTGNAQDNLDIAIPFVIPEAKQGAYQYYTIQIDDLWYATGTHLSISEMFFFHKTQNYRNYQYKQIKDFDTTTYNDTYTDIAGFTGSNLLQITTLHANSKVRVHFIIRGESANPNVHDLQFNLVRRVNGANPTDLNANLESSDQTATLANVEISAHQEAYHTMDTINIYYIDSLDNVPTGSVVSYTPQVKDFYATSGNTFRLNSVKHSIGDTGQYERTISISEAEEISTGPPLTVNNVAISSTPTAGDFIQYNGSAWTNTSVSLNDYVYQRSYEKSGVESFDVNGSGPSYYSSSDELLHYNGGTISTSSSVNILVSDTEDYYVYWDADSLVHQRGSTASTITESITDVAISSMGTIIIYISGNTLKYMNGGTEIFTETTTGALKCALNSAGDTFAVLYSTKVEIYNLAYLASSPHLVGTINFSAGVSCENVDIDNSPYFPLQVVVETLNSSNNITLYEIYYNYGNLDNDGGIFYNYQSLYTGGEGRPRFGYFAYFLHANNTLYYKRDYTPATGYYKLTDNVSKISRSGFDYVYKINDVLKHYKLRNGTFHEWHGNVRPIFTNLQDAVGNSGQDMGTFTGSVIQDNKSVKVALQDLETELETKASALNDLTDVSVVNASDLLSYANQPSGSVFSSVHHGGDSYDNLYDGQRRYGNGVDDTYFMIKNTEGTSAAPFELIYTPTSPETVTQVQVWASTGHNGGDDDAYPQTIRVMGELDGSYVEIGSQTLASASFENKSGDTVTSSNSLHNFTINPNRIAYTKYKLEMYDLYDPGIFNSQYFCKIAEVNFRGIKDGQPLVYDATAGEWQPGSVALDDLTDVSVANAVAQAGHALVYNSSNQWVPAFPQLPYIKVSQTNSASNLTTDGFHFMPFDTVEQSSHNIFSTTNYYHIDVPAGVYLVILNVGYNIVQTDGPDPNYPNPPPPNPFLSAIIERGINGDFVYDGGPMNLPNVSNGRQVTTPSVVTSLSSAGTIRFKMYLYRMNINLYGGARTNQAYIVKIG